MTKRERERLTKAIRDYGETHFEAGEWDRNESDESWDTVYGRLLRAQARVEKMLDIKLDRSTVTVPTDEIMEA